MSNVSLDANDSSVTENQPQDNNRRRFLTVATSVVGGVGVAGLRLNEFSAFRESSRKDPTRWALWI